MSRKYGYARVSSKEQNPQRQVDALLLEGVLEENIIVEKISGGTISERPAYLNLRGQLLRENDILVICELDRLSRNYEQLQKEYQYFRDNKIGVIVLEHDLLSTVGKSDLETQLISNIIFQLMSYLAEKERLKINERQRQGIAVAQAEGKHLGRPRVERPPKFQEVYNRWRANQCTAQEAMAILGLKRTTFYRFAKELRDAEDNMLNKTP